MKATVRGHSIDHSRQCICALQVQSMHTYMPPSDSDRQWTPATSAFPAYGTVCVLVCACVCVRQTPLGTVCELTKRHASERAGCHHSVACRLRACVLGGGVGVQGHQMTKQQTDSLCREAAYVYRVRIMSANPNNDTQSAPPTDLSDTGLAHDAVVASKACVNASAPVHATRCLGCMQCTTQHST